MTGNGNGKAGSAGRVGDKGEIWIPDMAYTCGHRGMKVFKIRRDGMPLSKQLGVLVPTLRLTPAYMVPTS